MQLIALSRLEDLDLIQMVILKDHSEMLQALPYLHSTMLTLETTCSAALIGIQITLRNLKRMKVES